MRAHAVHQGQHANGGNAQHGDLSHRVIAPEVNQNDVDHIGAPPGNGRLVKEVPGNGVMITGQHDPGEPGHARPTAQCDKDVAPFAPGA